MQKWCGTDDVHQTIKLLSKLIDHIVRIFQNDVIWLIFN